MNNKNVFHLFLLFEIRNFSSNVVKIARFLLFDGISAQTLKSFSMMQNIIVYKKNTQIQIYINYALERKEMHNLSNIMFFAKFYFGQEVLHCYT